MRISKKVKAKWFELEDIKIQIKPFPFSALDINKIDDALWQQFNYCICEWDGLVDDDDKVLKCNEENKKLIYDFVPEIREFVFEKINEYSVKIEKQSKN